MDYLTFNGIGNSQLGLKVMHSNHLSIPGKKVDLIDIPGRTGSLIIEDGSFNNLEIEIIFFLDTRKTKDLVNRSKLIGNWLQGHRGYKDLVFSDGTKLKAKCMNQIDISRLARNVSEFKVNFSCYSEEVQ